MVSTCGSISFDVNKQIALLYLHYSECVTVDDVSIETKILTV